MACLSFCLPFYFRTYITHTYTVMSVETMGSHQSVSNIPKYEGIEAILGREKIGGELYLDANTTLWHELFSPVGGCQKQKNPLNLVYVTGIVKEDLEGV